MRIIGVVTKTQGLCRGIVYLPMYVASVATMAAIIMIAVTFFDTLDIDAPGIAGVDLLNATL